MNIGEASRASGVSEKMVRHYEAIGLLHPARQANGYRSYADADVAVLRFIRHARDLAFPLEDVRRLLALWRDRDRASAEVRSLAMGHVEALEEKARALQAMATSLKHLAANCHGDDRPDCPILDQIAEGPRDPEASIRSEHDATRSPKGRRAPRHASDPPTTPLEGRHG